MYDSVYGLLEQFGYATKLPSPLFYDDNGQECPQDQAFAMPVDLQFTRPELVFCADECGTNTNMSNDRLSGGNKRVHKKGTNVTIPSCTSDTHFTTMGFTALDGRPVCCVVIIQKKAALTFSERFGLDIDAPWQGDCTVFEQLKAKKAEADEATDDSEASTKLDGIVIPVELLEANLGEGRVFPGGPTCHFNGNEIPPFVTSSESGGITPEILVSILKHLDRYGAASRKEGDPPPCLIVDGHGSRLSLPFLNYINNLDENGNKVQGSNHEWKAFFGLPNGTAYWQIADSSYINGKYKVRMRKQKESLREDQIAHGESIEIKRYNVVPMIRNCFSSSFGDLKGNKKAIIERGWNPLNRACLVMPDIEKTKTKAAFKQTQLPLEWFALLATSVSKQTHRLPKGTFTSVLRVGRRFTDRCVAWNRWLKRKAHPSCTASGVVGQEVSRILRLNPLHHLHHLQSLVLN
jgi:hypothetical protein